MTSEIDGKPVLAVISSFRGAEAPANTDHVLVISEMRIAPYKPRKLQAPARKFDTARLTQEPALQQLYNVTVQNKFNLL